MQKTAQKRSVLNRLREMTNVSGIAAEKFFNPQFQEVMENLRAIDATIRAIATGQQIEGADPDPGNSGETRSLKDLLKSAKSNFNRREYMTSVAELGRFHQKFVFIVQQIGKLDTKVNEIHHKFLFQDLDDEHKKELSNMKSRWAAEGEASLIKEASIMDFLHNIVNKRGRALAFYEKRYPREIGRLKKDTTSLITESERMLATLLSSLKDMASGRAARNVDAYVKAADKVKTGYERYDNFFKGYYNTNVKGFLDKVEIPSEKVDDKGLGKTEIPTKEVPDLDLPSVKTAPSVDESEEVTQPGANVPGYGLPIPGPPRMPTNVGPSIPPPPDTQPSLPPQDMESNPPVGETMMGVAPPANKPRGTLPYTGILAHKNFMESLESLSGEAPLILASYIKKYAQSIQGQDPEVAIKLLQVAKAIRG